MTRRKKWGDPSLHALVDLVEKRFDPLDNAALFVQRRELERNRDHF